MADSGRGKKNPEKKKMAKVTTKKLGGSDSGTPVKSSSGNTKPSAVGETSSPMNTRSRSSIASKHKNTPVFTQPSTPILKVKPSKGKPIKQIQPTVDLKKKNIETAETEDPNPSKQLPMLEKQTSVDIKCKVSDSIGLVEPENNTKIVPDKKSRESSEESCIETSQPENEIEPDKSRGSSEESCVETSQPVTTERKQSVDIPCEVSDSMGLGEELKNGTEIVSDEKSTGCQEGSNVHTSQPIVNERQSKNSESSSAVNVNGVESTGVNEESTVNSKSLALGNEAVYEKKIRSIDSELDSLFHKISEINLKIKKLHDEDDKVENESLEILRELKDILESFEEENDNSKTLELDRNVEIYNPKAMLNKESRILELRTLLQLRTRKSIGLMVLQTQKSHWIELLDELFRRRSSTMTDLNSLKSESECLNALHKDISKQELRSGMGQDVVPSTAAKTILWEKQPVLTKERLTASLGSLVFSKLWNLNWVDFTKKKIAGNIQWQVDQRTMSELKENVDRAVRVAMLSDDVDVKELLKFKALILEGSLGFESSIGTEVGETDCEYREVCRPSSGALALDNIGVVSSELSTRIDEIQETHSESCEVLEDLCGIDSAETVVNEKVDWIDSVLMIKEVSSMESKSQFEEEKQTAYSELVDFFKETDQLDSKIMPLDEQALEHVSEKAFLSRKLTRCMFEHPSPKVSTRSDAESFALDSGVGMSNADLLRFRMQQLKRMSTIGECREYVSESQLKLLQRRNLLVKQKSKLQEHFKQEFKSKFHPAASSGVLKMQKAELMAHLDSLIKRKSKLMARLKALSKRNDGVIKQVNVKQLL